MKTFAIIAVLLIGPLLGQGPGEQPMNAGRIAQQVGEESVRWTWKASAHDLTLVPEMSVFPIGMTAVTDGGDMVFTLTGNTLGLFTAEITVTAEVPPFPGWTGEMIKAQQTIIIPWVVFDPKTLLFLDGFGDVLLPEPTN